MNEYANDTGMGVGNAVSPVVDQAKEVASQVTSEAKELITTGVMRRQQQSAMELTSLANALREKGEEMEHSLLAPVVSKAADQMERASDYLKDATFKDTVRATERLARREPLLFLGGAFTLGLVCARFLRSSAHHDTAGPGEQPGMPVRP